jgi:potassium efflux system protein
VMIARLITLILDEDIFPRMEMRRGVASMLSTMTRYAIVTVGFVFAAGIAGIEMTQIALLVSALGVGIGFGLQGLVSNIVAGLILIFERPINPGDTIEFGSRMGTVGQIGPRASVVHGFDGSEIIVPNSALISSEVVNYTLTDRRRRVEIPVGVAYGSNPGAVADLLVSAVQKTTGVLSSPEPLALFQGFGASSLDFIVRFWVADFDTALPTRSDAAMAIYRALEEKGIQIPFPQRDLHLRLTQPGSEVPEGGREDRAEPRRRPRNRNK